MIEAVNSTLATSSVTRNVAEQLSSARSFAANPEKVQEVARAPYVSPYISVDVNFDRAILQIRDSDSGDVLTQYPTESQLRAYQRAQQTQTTDVRSPEEVQASLSVDSADRAQEVQIEQQAAVQTQTQISAPVTEAVSVSTEA